MDRNGYFILENKDGGTYISQIQPEGKGQPATLEWLVTYLNKKKIPFVNGAQLKNIMEQTADGKSVQLLSTETTPFNGWCDYTIAPNQMMAQLVMYPPMKGMKDVESKEVIGDIQNLKIVFGVNEKLIDLILQAKRYFENFVFAKGKPARDGKDAVLTYNFNPEVDTTPTILDNGTVDFHKLDLINHVNAGDVVATITPEDPGESGVNVLGIEIKPKKVTRQIFHFGHNLHVSEDGKQLISDVTGLVTLEGERVFVSNEYTVEADVDTSTGDIEFEGNVHVRGAVRSDYKIHASGNVVVDGVVEAAEIVAGGDIILGRGISGQGRGTLESGGKIISTFIESAQVRAADTIEVGAILHSTVYAGNTIEAKGKGGTIIGGKVRAGALIVAKEIGSPMGTNTVITMGSESSDMNSWSELEAKIQNENDMKQKAVKIIEVISQKRQQGVPIDTEKLKMLQSATASVKMLTEAIEKDTKELNALKSRFHDAKNGRIQASSSIFPGVKLEFGQDSYFVRDRFDHCQFIKSGADITMTAL